MTDQLQDIRNLLPLLDMAFRAEQMKMAQVARRISELQTQLAALNRPESFDPMSVASRSGADVLWETWVQDRKALIMQELALAHRDREAVRATLIKALSKVESAKQMEARRAAQQRQTKERRTNW